MKDQRASNLLKYVVPSVLGKICFFLFTIVDGIFVGHGVGTNGLGAVNLVMPFVMTVGALFMLATTGGVTVTAIRIGRGDTAGAEASFLQSLALTIGVSVVLTVIGTCFTRPVCRLLGANETFIDMVAEYLFWYSVFIIPNGLSTSLQGFCMNDGSPVLVSVAVIVGTCCNIFGDWLTIFPLHMGLAGAAIATGVSQTAVLLVLLLHFFKRRGVLRFKGKITNNGALLKKIIVRGTPDCIAQFTTPVTTLCMNYVLIDMIGDIAVNAFSIISYVASFSVAIFLGTAAGLQPMFGNCYGEKETRDLKFYFRSGLLINLIGSIIINILLYFFGGHICLLFGADEATWRFTMQTMPTYAWGFIIMGLNTIIGTYLYSTKRSKEAIIINVLRSFVVNIAVILLFPRIFGVGIIWHTFFIYEVISLAVAWYLVKKSERNGIIYK